MRDQGFERVADQRRLLSRGVRVAVLAAVALCVGGGAQATQMMDGELWWSLHGVNPGNLCQTVGGPKLCSYSNGFDTSKNRNLDHAPGGYEGVRGNTLTFTDQGFDVIAAAFATTGSGDTFETAFLGNYSGGLGVLNENGSDPHFVSNSDDTDLVIFSFMGDDFLPTGVRLTNFGDSDVTILVGGTAADFASGGDPFAGFAGLTFQDLEDQGFARLDDLDDDSGRSRTVDVDLGSGRYLVVAAYEGHHYERFKIKKVHGVAEPGVGALLAAGLAGLAIFGRRRAR
ncbi:MAG: hypothetical protein QNK05_11735 [Myxococcota bacterium]|nr:hypothetical protein [Myxococcota bacterium]